MEFLPLFKKLLVGFLVILIGNTAINRADLDALFVIMRADALGTLIRIYYINSFRFSDSLVGALGLAGSATYTLIRNL